MKGENFCYRQSFFVQQRELCDDETPTTEKILSGKSLNALSLKLFPQHHIKSLATGMCFVVCVFKEILRHHFELCLFLKELSKKFLYKKRLFLKDARG